MTGVYLKRRGARKHFREREQHFHRVMQRFDNLKTAEIFALARTQGEWWVKLEMTLERSKAILSLKMRILAFTARGSRGCAMRPCLIYSLVSLFFP